MEFLFFNISLIEQSINCKNEKKINPPCVCVCVSLKAGLLPSRFTSLQKVGSAEGWNLKSFPREPKITLDVCQRCSKILNRWTTGLQTLDPDVSTYVYDDVSVCEV